jgi:hypothetical protein
MVGKYGRKWFEVHRIVSRAQKEIYGVVEEICKALIEDMSGFLEGLRGEYDFTYVIEPRVGDGDVLKCVPCLFIEADEGTFNAVRDAVLSRFSEVISESRLVIERKPAQPKILE